MRSDVGKMETDNDTYTQKQAFALLHSCTLTNEHSCSHSHFDANTHIQQTSFPLHQTTDVRALFSFLQESGRKKKEEKAFDLNGIIT